MKNKLIRIIIGGAIFAAALIAEFSAGVDLWYLHTAAYLILGLDIVWRAVRGIVRGHLFDENFLMTIATIGAFIIGEFPEAVAVMLFYQVGEFASTIAYDRSIASVTALMDMRPEYANLLADGVEKRVAPESVSAGDLIVVKAGEKIPLDGIVEEGSATLDTAAMTGEFLPRDIAVGDEVTSGCINKNGLFTLRVTKPFGESAVSKVLELIQNAAQKKAKAEKFITKFARIYTPVVVLIAALLAVVPPLAFGGIWSDWVHRGLIFLVVSCPCALMLSVPLGYFAGLGRASREGVLVKGGDYLDALTRIDTMAFDKTGTLTEGRFSVSGIFPAEGVEEQTLLEYATAAEQNSNHPVAAAIREKHKKIEEGQISEYREIAGHGISVKYKGKTVLAGNQRLMEQNGVEIEQVLQGTKVFVAAEGSYLGCITLSDTVKPDSKKALQRLRELGVKHTVMLTGDNQAVAEEIAKAAGVDEVYAGLLPHQKAEVIEKLGDRLAFVGDGINDAPALKRAAVGIAMGGLGSDAAIEAADAVLMSDKPSDIAAAIKTAKRVRKIVTQNIVFILAVKAATLVLGALGLAGMWAAVFADIGTSLLAVLNSMRILK